MSESNWKELAWKPKLKQVNCIYIPATDPEKTKEWFARHFGINDNGWMKLGVGTLMFVKAKEKPHLNFKTDEWAGPDYDMNVISFAVDHIDDLHRSLVEEGVKVDELIDDGGCGVSFCFYDPDGNKYSAWDLQVMVRKNPQGNDSPNWKERLQFDNCCFECDIDTFFAKIIEDAPGARHSRIQIVEHAKLRESDPEALEKLFETLDQFSLQHPEHAFDIVFYEHFR